jgi:uncharacterized protein (TIGR02284 family)
MDNDETIDVLNRLIQINNDRIEGYQTAAEETEEADLQAFFEEMEKTSHHCKNELSAVVVKLGGTPTESTKLSGKFFRVWMDVKAAINGKDRKVILNSCEYGEDQARDTYEDALDEESENLNPEQMAMISIQYQLLKADHDRVKSMRDAVLADA